MVYGRLPDEWVLGTVLWHLGIRPMDAPTTYCHRKEPDDCSPVTFEDLGTRHRVWRGGQVYKDMNLIEALEEAKRDGFPFFRKVGRLGERARDRVRRIIFQGQTVKG